MKKYMLAVFLLHTGMFAVSAQDADAIVGIWHSPHGNTGIRIFKKDNSYFGITTLLQEARSGHGHAVSDTGILVLKDFKYRNRGVYTRGGVLDLKSGRNYNGQMRLINNDRLDIRIFFGIIQFGRTETWMRTKSGGV